MFTNKILLALLVLSIGVDRHRLLAHSFTAVTPFSSLILRHQSFGHNYYDGTPKKRKTTTNSQAVYMTTTQDLEPSTSTKKTKKTNKNNGVIIDRSKMKTGYTTDQIYSRCLTPSDKLLRDDGYKTDSKWKKIAMSPIRAVFGKKRRVKPGSLIIVRHGESEFSVNGTFTGWADPDLTEKGIQEAEHAARLLLESGYEIDVVFTSRLKRAIRSTSAMLREMDMMYLPIYKSWRLNERNTGLLTGSSALETVKIFGETTVQAWRGNLKRKGALKAKPPPLEKSDPNWPGRMRTYADLSDDEVPLTESMNDCVDRTTVVYEERILNEIKNGRNVLVVTHDDTIRCLVKIIDGIGELDIQDVNVPAGIPIVYKFDEDLAPIKPDEGAKQQPHVSGVFLEKPGLLEKALKIQAEFAARVPGFDEAMSQTRKPMTSLERALYTLKIESSLENLVDSEIYDGVAETGDDDISVIEDDFDEGFEMAGDNDNNVQEESTIEYTVKKTPQVNVVEDMSFLPGISDVPIKKDAVIVMIRHGKTPHNALGLFTGWDDPPLHPDGREQAIEAGRMLKKNGYEFDVVYTSWLSRAIETAWLAMDEMDAMWLPIIKSWRLNERMYGDLTNLSKKMIAQKYGADQLIRWRRGYAIRPPKVSSFSPNYPGNSPRSKHIKDLRISYSESLIRSVEQRKLVLHRKFPKTECLKDCMARTIPFFTERIIPEAVNKGKRVLIASSENAIRGLLMKLCDIPESKIANINIPNGVPLIYDVKSQCIKILPDEQGRDPMEVHDFGSSPELLFQPCIVDFDDPEQFPNSQ